MDPMDSIGRLSNPHLSIVYTSGFILWLNFRYLKWTLLYFRFHFSTRLRRTPGFVHWNLVESIGHAELKRLRAQSVDEVNAHYSYVQFSRYVEMKVSHAHN